MNFACEGKVLECLESREISCVSRRNIWNASSCGYIKFWWNNSAIGGVTKRSSVCGDKSVNIWPIGTDVASRYQSTRADPSPNCTINVATWCTSGGDLKRSKCVFCSSKSLPSLLWWNKLFNVFSTKFEMSASGSNVHNFLRVANFCAWVIKNEQILSTVIFQRVNKFKL